MDLEHQADALLDSAPQDPEYPFYTRRAEDRRRRGRGRSNASFREVALSEMIAALDDKSEQVAGFLDTQKLLDQSKITVEERLAFLLRVRYQLTDQEIADLYGISRSAVAERQQSARAKLRKVIDPTTLLLN